jgi:hypothetical protein
VVGSFVPVALPFWTVQRIALFGTCAAVGVFLAVYVARRRRTPEAAARGAWEPSRITPLGVVTSLRRLEQERGGALDNTQIESLRREISTLELKYFGPDAKETTEPELREVIDRWSSSAR